MLFLIYGGKGWIGSQFIELLKNKKIKYILGKERVNDRKLIEEEIKNIKPTHVLSFIGRTSGGNYNTIDYLEDNLYENVRDNLFSPIILSLLSHKYNYHFSYLGTGCIFDYDKTEDNNYNYNSIKKNEDDIPNFYGSSYSIVKGFTDELLHLQNVLNFRIRMPISSKKHIKNFITKITNYEYICSIPNSMTILDELLPIMLDLIIKKHIGTINLVNPGVISHNEILESYKQIVDNNFKWKNFSIDEQNKILKSKRSNNHLDTKLLESLYKVENIKTGIIKILKKY